MFPLDKGCKEFVRQNLYLSIESFSSDGHLNAEMCSTDIKIMITFPNHTDEKISQKLGYTVEIKPEDPMVVHYRNRVENVVE